MLIFNILYSIQSKNNNINYTITIATTTDNDSGKGNDNDKGSDNDNNNYHVSMSTNYDRVHVNDKPIKMFSTYLHPKFSAFSPSGGNQQPKRGHCISLGDT